MDGPRSGSIVIVDWRGGSRSKEPNKARPAVVIEDSTLFDEAHPSCLVVPLTTSEAMAIPGLCVAIEPTAANGCMAKSYALAFNVTAVARSRVRATSREVTSAQLASIRSRVCMCIGVLV